MKKPLSALVVVAAAALLLSGCTIQIGPAVSSPAPPSEPKAPVVQEPAAPAAPVIQEPTIVETSCFSGTNSHITVHNPNSERIDVVVAADYRDSSGTVIFNRTAFGSVPPNSDAEIGFDGNVQAADCLPSVYLDDSN